MNLNNEILNYFLYKKIIKKNDRATIETESKRLGVTPENYMLLKGYCTEVTALEALGEFFNLPYIEVDMLDIDKEYLKKFSYAFMKKHKFLPVSVQKSGTLLLAVGRPLDYYALSAVATVHTGPVDYILVPPSQVDKYIDSIVAVISTSQALDDLHHEDDDDFLARANNVGVATTEHDDDVINNPAVRLVDSIIKEAIPFRASDIHIEPFEKTVKVRYRIDGDLQERAEFTIGAYSAISARLKIMSGMNIAERRIPQDGRINLVINGTEYDFRVSSLPTVYGEKFVIRVLDKTSFRFTRADLGFTDAENPTIDRILSHPHGVVLLTGPTGCGKSTTLYAFLKEVNKTDVNIITVEDPVEYTMAGINQTQVNNKANLTFATALRSILRQDPDIIMIGEIRDEETAQIAIRAAIKGHLVFSTLHTNDAPGAVTRLEDMGVQNYLVADAVVGVIAQRLVKRLCPACKKKGKTTAAEMEILGIDEPISIYRPQGCQFCNYTGYKGRIGIHEIMYVNEAIRVAIGDNTPIETLREIARDNGMVPLWNGCQYYVLKGLTSIQELMSLTVE